MDLLLTWSGLLVVAVVALSQVVRWSANHPSIRSSGHPARQPKGDERGAVLVQTLLILPVLILVVFGGYTVWKVASVKHSLHSGTYQATRYLCLNPVDSLDPGRWEEVVDEIVAREVGNNGLAQGASLLPTIVTIHGSTLECGMRFTVETQIKLRIGMSRLSTILILGDRHEGWVEC